MSAHSEGFKTRAMGKAAHAEGNNSIAIGAHAHAEGRECIANDGSHAEGFGTFAHGWGAHAEGFYTTAIRSESWIVKSTGVGGDKRIDIGSNNLSVGDTMLIAFRYNAPPMIDTISYKNGDYIEFTNISDPSNCLVILRNFSSSSSAPHAEGFNTVSSSYHSHAEGSSTIAKGVSSHAEGAETIALGSSSHAEGTSSVAGGTNSHAAGYYTTADIFAGTAIGSYNKPMAGSATMFNSSADAFVIGNGSSSSRSNAFRVAFNGNVYGLSAFNSSGADYAEYFEWQDGNPNNEDRTGLFVTLDGDKIRKATNEDEFILGVVSVNPSVVGDSHQDDWNQKYLKDKWGRIRYQYIDEPEKKQVITHNPEYEIKYSEPEIGDQGEIIKEGYYEEVLVKEGYVEEIIISPAGQEYLPVLNPEWDSNMEYIPREQRKEWSAIGMMGKLLVRDDGTCVVNGYCTPNGNGIATRVTTGYRVMKRVAPNIILILVK
ncbi:hypothetical protein DQG23_35175 [Paenibacillus contaminans]|uniref:Uncharacterized protein n=2 Tax=Paenibacillus contaminans TaxID=450362 RepID=A0A329LWY3_9BACL|nr:hypothetical protein DQG23_35175 [Paenibacillus contaminans]